VLSDGGLRHILDVVAQGLGLLHMADYKG